MTEASSDPSHEADFVLHLDLAALKDADLAATEKACRREFEVFIRGVIKLLAAQKVSA